MSSKGKRLKEFDLDAPALSKTERLQFRNQTRFITSNIERHFGDFYNAAGIWKVLVEVVPRPENSGVKNLLGVAVVQIEGDPAPYSKKSEMEKAELCIRWLSIGVGRIFEFFNWPSAQLEQAIQKVELLKFENTWKWKTATSPGRTLTADVLLTMTSQKVVANVQFRKNKQLICQKVIFESEPNELIFSSRLGAIEWIDDSSMKLTSKSGNEQWLSTCEVST